MTLKLLALNLMHKRKQILLMKINQSGMLQLLFLFSATTFHSILIFIPDTFLGDSAFNAAELYGKLFHDFHFSRTLIPYNLRNESSLKKLGTMLMAIQPASMTLLFP